MHALWVDAAVQQHMCSIQLGHPCSYSQTLLPFEKKLKNILSDNTLIQKCMMVVEEAATVDQPDPIITVADLPEIAIEKIVAALDVEDKYSLSCVCKMFFRAVQQSWKMLRFVVDDTSFANHVPNGLQHWCSLETVLICGKSYSNYTRGLFYEITRDEPTTPIPLDYTFIKRFKELNTLIYRPDKHLKLIIRLEELVLPGQLETIFKCTTPSKPGQGLEEMTDFTHRALGSSTTAANTDEKQRLKPFSDSFCAESFEQLYPGKIPDFKADPTLLEEITTMAAASKLNSFMSSLKQSTGDQTNVLGRVFEAKIRLASLSFTSSSSPHKPSKKEIKKERANTLDLAKKVSKEIQDKAEAIMKRKVVVSGSMYTGGIDVGWFVPDGNMADDIVAGAMAWCDHVQEDLMQLEKYKKLHSFKVIGEELHCWHVAYDPKP